MSEGYLPIKGKCTWWREMPLDEDRWNARIRDHEKRVACTCFVEGKGWIYARWELPEECPDSRRCRYYVRHM